MHKIIMGERQRKGWKLFVMVIVIQVLFLIVSYLLERF